MQPHVYYKVLELKWAYYASHSRAPFICSLINYFKKGLHFRTSSTSNLSHNPLRTVLQVMSLTACNRHRSLGSLSLSLIEWIVRHAAKSSNQIKHLLNSVDWGGSTSLGCCIKGRHNIKTSTQRRRCSRCEMGRRDVAGSCPSVFG